jgi:hypothetical protein
MRVIAGWLLVIAGIPVACDGLALLSDNFLLGIANLAISAALVGSGIMLIRKSRS